MCNKIAWRLKSVEEEVNGEVVKVIHIVVECVMQVKHALQVLVASQAMKHEEVTKSKNAVVCKDTNC